MAKEKQTIKRLTFTEDAAELALLAVAEAQVEAGEFPSFNELCKAALQAFLTPVSAPQPSAPAPVDSLAAQLTQIEDALGALHAALQGLATPTTAPDTAAETEVTLRLAERLEQLAQEMAEVHTGQGDLQEVVQQIREQMTASATATEDTTIARLPEQLTQLSQTVDQMRADQRDLHDMVQQVSVQTATPVAADEDETATRLAEQLEQLTQDIATMQRGQQTLAESVRAFADQMQTPATAPQPTLASDAVLQSLHELQTTQEALQSEVRQLAERLTSELAKLQMQAAPVNGSLHPVLPQSKQTDAPVVSQETVSHLARFLEDF